MVDRITISKVVALEEERVERQTFLVELNENNWGEMFVGEWMVEL